MISGHCTQLGCETRTAEVVKFVSVGVSVDLAEHLVRMLKVHEEYDPTN